MEVGAAGWAQGFEHQLPGPRDQVVEDRELRSRQQNALLLSGASAAPEALVCRVETEGTELCHKGKSSGMGALRGTGFLM